VKQQPDERAVFEQREVSEDQALTENGANDGYVHRISDITIESGNNQMASWEDRRGRADALQCESAKRIQKANDPQRNQYAASKSENWRPEKWWFESPMGYPPGHQTGYKPWGDDQEDRRTHDRRHSPDHALM
jgi:hypothetical protein